MTDFMRRDAKRIFGNASASEKPSLRNRRVKSRRELSLEERFSGPQLPYTVSASGQPLSAGI